MPLCSKRIQPMPNIHIAYFCVYHRMSENFHTLAYVSTACSPLFTWVTFSKQVIGSALIGALKNNQTQIPKIVFLFKLVWFVWFALFTKKKYTLKLEFMFNSNLQRLFRVVGREKLIEKWCLLLRIEKRYFFVRKGDIKVRIVIWGKYNLPSGMVKNESGLYYVHKPFVSFLLISVSGATSI